MPEEIDLLARDLFRQAENVSDAAGSLVPAELARAGSDGPLILLALEIDELLRRFNQLQRCMGLPDNQKARYECRVPRRSV
jgi:hypothetical protein